MVWVRNSEEKLRKGVEFDFREIGDRDDGYYWTFE
jgi:hypothetical protein